MCRDWWVPDTMARAQHEARWRLAARQCLHTTPGHGRSWRGQCAVDGNTQNMCSGCTRQWGYKGNGEVEADLCKDTVLWTSAAGRKDGRSIGMTTSSRNLGNGASLQSLRTHIMQGQTASPSQAMAEAMYPPESTSAAPSARRSDLMAMRTWRRRRLKCGRRLTSKQALPP